MWFKSAWILPVNRDPIPNAWIEIDQEKILTIQDYPPKEKVHELNHSMIMPGLINAHIHLEWSHFRGKIKPQNTFIDWLHQIKTLSIENNNPDQTIREAIDEVYQSGTSLICEIANTKKSIDGLGHSLLDSIIFEEIVGWNNVDFNQNQDGIHYSVHSLHGLSSDIIKKIIDLHDHELALPIHFAENEEEIKFLEEGLGPFKNFFEKVYPNQSIPSPKKSLLEYAQHFDFPNIPLLLVHCVQLSDDQLKEIKNWNSSICICPRSNHFTGVGMPPLKAMLDHQLNICIGTDGLSSNEDLNLFKELSFTKKQFPFLNNRTLLEMATINGAKALKKDAIYGSIECGKKNDLLVFQSTENITDPENWIIENGFKQYSKRLNNLEC